MSPRAVMRASLFASYRPVAASSPNASAWPYVTVNVTVA